MAITRPLPSGDRRYRDTDPLALASLIQRFRRRRPLQRVHALASAESRPAPDRSGIARVTLVLQGIRRVSWARGQGVVAHDLRQGTAIVVTPAAWSRPLGPHRPHHYLSIDSYPHFTRFICEGVAGARNRPGAGAFYSGGPLAPPARGLLQSLMALAESDDPTAEARMVPVLDCYLDEVLRDCRPWTDTAGPRRHWQRATSWIHDHIDPELSRDRIAGAIEVHPNHLSRLCRRFTGTSLAAYLTEVRMQRARDLLRSTDLSVQAIIPLAGYRDETHFRKRFKELHGETPGRWRQRCQSQH